MGTGSPGPAFTTGFLDLRPVRHPVGWEQGLQVDSRLLFPSVSAPSQCHRGWGQQSMRAVGDGAWRRPTLGTARPSPARTGCAGGHPDTPAPRLPPTLLPTPHPHTPLTPDGVMGVRSLPHGLDHSSAPHPEARTNSNPSVKQQPDPESRLLAGPHLARKSATEPPARWHYPRRKTKQIEQMSMRTDDTVQHSVTSLSLENSPSYRICGLPV